MRLAISIIVFLAIIAMVILLFIPQDAQVGFTGLSLQDSSDDEVAFSVENNMGRPATYDIMVEQTDVEGSTTSSITSASVDDGSDVTFYYPLGSETATAKVVLPQTGQEISIDTGKVKEVIPPKKEWKPEIVPDLPWERQDPIVRHFYRYDYDQSQTYEREGRA